MRRWFIAFFGFLAALVIMGIVIRHIDVRRGFATKPPYWANEIDSETSLHRAAESEVCVIMTEVKWSTATVWNCHQFSMVSHQWRDEDDGNISFYILDLTDPAEFIVTWLRAHPEISEHANGGTGEVICMRRGTIVEIIRHFKTMEDLRLQIRKVFSIQRFVP